MKRMIFGGLLAASAGPLGNSWAADDTGALYISPMAQYTFLDHRRDFRDNTGYEVALGANVAKHLATEIAVSNGSFSPKGFPPTLGGAHEKLTTATLDFLFKFVPGSTFSPYLLAGGGGLKDVIGGHNDGSKSWVAEAGAGVWVGLGNQTGRTRLQLRAEGKYRWDFIKHTTYIPNNPGDIVAGIGLQLMFGAPTPPVAAAPPPPPPPEPPVTTAPAPPPPPPPCHAPAGFQVDANCHIIEQSVIVRAVDFEFNSAQLTAPAQQTLDEVAASLVNQPDLHIEIQGYTDSTGSAAYNLKLSQRRAESVKAYLVSKGVSPSALTAKGYGKANPIATNATTEGRAQNRRVAFEVTNAPAHVKVVTKEATPASTEAAKQGEPERAKKEHRER